MRREELEHLVASAANIVGDDDFVVIGSQAVLGNLPDPPAELLASMEADMYPMREPDKAVDIDGVLGDASPFFELYGYYAHGVGPETAKAPAGWQDRLVRVPVPPRVRSVRQPVAWCMEIHDLVLAKLARGIERDYDYASTAIAKGLVDVVRLRKLVDTLPVGEPQRQVIADYLAGPR